MASNAWLEDAFSDARRDFFSELKNPLSYQFLRFGTIEDVYDEVEKIQKIQSKSKSLVALRRIEPYIEGLRDYIGAMDTFAQLKPEFICLIWGPLKMILQFASSVATAFQKLLGVLKEVGAMLPQFRKYAESKMFDQNNEVKSMMCLFYRDILDLHMEMLNFFNKKGLHMALEALWPTFRRKLAAIQGNIENHKMIMNSNVTLEHVLQAYHHRRITLQKHEDDKKYQNQMRLKILSDIMTSVSCHSKLHSSIEATSAGSGEWFFSSLAFQSWLNSKAFSEKGLWIRGIPGAGKTNLTANVIHHLRNEGRLVLFVFLSHDSQFLGDPIPILHSLIIQAINADHDKLVPIVWDAYTNKRQDFTSDSKFVKELFLNIAKDSGSLFVVVDGLDEINDHKRRKLAPMLLEALEGCENLKLLLSARSESDIVGSFNDKMVSVRVDENNGPDIGGYVQSEAKGWFAELRALGADDSDCSEIAASLNGVVTRAKGMFLYAKLVLGIAKSQPDLNSIRAELANLPNGLDQAYKRILIRIHGNPIAKRILQWVGCAKVPLTECEVLQALLIDSLMTDFTKQRKLWLDINAACGSVIEMKDGVVRFVHFTAFEYLFGMQSDNFLSRMDGHFEAISSCLTFFLFNCFDEIFSADFANQNEKNLQSRILSGDFILFRYAADFWLEHVRALTQNSTLEDERADLIHRLLARFYKERGNTATTDESDSSSFFLADFQYFSGAPTIQNSLAASAQFLDRLRYGHTTPDDEDWIYEDPTAVSLAVERFEVALGSMVENCEHSSSPTQCDCQILSKLYGTKVFKCKWRFCQFHHNGFSSIVERDSHEQTHRRLNRCPASNCIYASLGFQYEEDLQKHRVAFHPDHGNPRDRLQPGVQLSGLTARELSAMLEHTILSDDLELTRNIIPVISEQGRDVDFNLLLQLAAWKGSGDLIDYLILQGKQLGVSGSTGLNTKALSTILENALLVSILLENFTTLRALVRNGTSPTGDGGVIHPDFRRRFLYPRGISIPYARRKSKKTRAIQAAFEQLSHKTLEILVDEFAVTMRPDGLFSSAIESTATSQNGQSGFPERWGNMSRFISPRDYSDGIRCAVIFKNKAALMACLESGGDPILPESYHKDLDSGLCAAVRWGPNDFIPIFLRAGADPYPSIKDEKAQEGGVAKSIKEMVGMKRVETYFGMSWDELVQKIRTGEDITPDHDFVQEEEPSEDRG